MARDGQSRRQLRLTPAIARERTPPRPRCAARARAARGGARTARQVEGLLRRHRGRRQDLRHAQRRAAQEVRRRRRGGRLRRSARTRGNRAAAGRPRKHSAAHAALRRVHAARVRPRRSDRTQAAAHPGRRASAHERSRCAPRKALAGHRGTPRRRHRCVDHRQRAAPRKPQRCGRIDHFDTHAGDRAGHGARVGRRGRADRSTPGRPVAAPARG